MKRFNKVSREETLQLIAGILALVAVFVAPYYYDDVSFFHDFLIKGIEVFGAVAVFLLATVKLAVFYAILCVACWIVVWVVDFIYRALTADSQNEPPDSR